MCQDGWWHWDVPGKVGGTAGMSSVVALGDTAQLLPSPPCSPSAPAGSPRSEVTPGFGICHLQEGSAGSGDSMSWCPVGFLRAGFWGLDPNSSFSRCFCASSCDVTSGRTGAASGSGKHSGILSHPEFLEFLSAVPRLGASPGHG